eukprot:TRINITY_DN34774_c0_g1_i1.p1 TRINITY_DN34774_c0_g1~~TRINITY_DN34774_c0_g1_i1.p1  ORF type:complete len:153 (-),score=50.04 TRINITY_DN34774_c0_g1_i1:36-494(-)
MFHLHHLMLRIKDPKVSLPFYTEVLGMKLACTKKFDSFSLYFLGFLDEVPTFESNREADEFLFKNRGTFLELTHNHGTENDDSFKVSNGNEPGHQGYGHIALTCPNVDDAVEKLLAHKVKFTKLPNDGMMKGLAFFVDPDNYKIELLPMGPL